MPELSPAERRALFYFGAIQAGTLAGESTAQIWDRIKATAAASGLDTPGIGIQQVNQMRAAANNLRTAQQRLSGAFGPSPIEGPMIGTAPWARPMAERNAIGMWQARFEHSFLTDGEESTEWRTVVFTGSLPGSVNDLNQSIFQDAAGMSDAYGTEHVGVGNISLMAI